MVLRSADSYKYFSGSYERNTSEQQRCWRAWHFCVRLELALCLRRQEYLAARSVECVLIRVYMRTKTEVTEEAFEKFLKAFPRPLRFDGIRYVEDVSLRGGMWRKPVAARENGKFYIIND